MNTKNLHHFPVHLSMFIVFGVLSFLPFSSFYFLGTPTNKDSQVLGDSSKVIQDVTYTTLQTNITNFKYSLKPYEVKTLNVQGNNVFLKQTYTGVIVGKLQDGTIEISNQTPNSYLIEGIIY